MIKETVTVTFSEGDWRALAEAVSDDPTRIAIQRIRVEMDADEPVAVATNGHLLLRLPVDVEGEMPDGGLALELPARKMKRITRGDDRRISAQIAPDARQRQDGLRACTYRACTHAEVVQEEAGFAAVGGAWPDWRAVLKQPQKSRKMDGHAMSAEMLIRLGTIARELGDRADSTVALVLPAPARRGNGAAHWVHIVGRDDVQMIAMPTSYGASDYWKLVEERDRKRKAA